MMRYLSVITLLMVSLAVQASEPTKVDELQSLLSRVAKEIAFEPYPGNLRSIDFVEQTGKANAFDRSMLLLDRVKAAGFRAHVVHGELLEPHRLSLIAALSGEQGGYLYSTASHSIEHALASHFWVEVLIDNQLVAMDAAFTDAKLGQSYGVKKGVVTSLAPYQYKFKVVHKLRNQSGKVVVMGTYSSTTSLQGIEPITLVTIAEPIVGKLERETSFMGGGMSGIAGGLAGGRTDSASKDGSVIGHRYETDLILNDRAKKVGQYKATTNIKGAAIEKEWLEITMTYPGESPVVVERSLFTARPNASPVDYRQLTISILPGSIPLDFKQAQLRSLAERQAKENGYVPSSDLLLEKSLNHRIGPQVGSLLNISIAAVSDAQTDKMAKRNQVVPVYGKPRIYITTLEGKQDSSTGTVNYQLSFDYRLDDISTYYLRKDEQARSYFFAIARGMQQSTIEGAMLGGLQKGSSFSTTDVMLHANQQGIEQFVLTPITIEKTDVLTGLSTVVRRHIEEKIEAGYHIIIPQRPVSMGNDSYLAWWQLDPVTGETQGVLESGLHGAMVEYNIMQREITLSDTRGFVLGILAGANTAQVTVMAHLLAGDSLDEATVSTIEKKLKQLACASCFNAGVSLELSLSITGSVNCFELFKIIAYDKKFELGGKLSFCDAYSAGFNCAVKMILKKPGDQTGVQINDPLSAGINLSCPSQ